MHADYTIFLFYFTIGLVVLVLILIFMILVMMAWKRRQSSRHKRISLRFSIWLTEIVLEEFENNHMFVIPHHIDRLLSKPGTREVLLEELITLKKSLNGSAGQNLRRLYKQLQLDELSVQKLYSKYWHLKAKGMQELAMMDQRQHFSTIRKYLNDPHPYIRMEAQTALVRYHGFRGLYFLNKMSYSLTEWQQLNLLQLLLNQPAAAAMNIGKLLHSPNSSAIQFALRLITEQHDAGYYDVVATCLHHTDDKVKKQAVYCLGELATQQTASLLITECMQYSKEIQLAVLHVLEKIGSIAELDFLHKHGLSNDADIRLTCMKAIQAIKQHKAGNTNYYSEEDIFLQTA
jgi:HEAT repeat protein